MSRALKADQSYTKLQQQVQDALTEARGTGPGGCYIVELFDDHVVYEEYSEGQPSTTWSRPYTVADDEVTLGDRTEVEREITYRAVKRVNADTIEGLALPYGGLFGGFDVDGDRFTPKTDFALEWFGRSGRPLLYDHGLDNSMKTSVIGRQIDYEERAEGIWAQAQIDKNARFRKAVDRLIEEEAVGFSSGAMPHLAKKSADGSITSWPWVELSLTPIPAAGDLAVPHYVKASDLLGRLEAVGTTMPSAALKAIASWADDRDAGSDTSSLDDQAGRVSAAIVEFRDHARASAEMRAKSGRVLSAANRERLAKALASKDAVLEAYADLEALLDETDPEAATKAADAIWAEFLRTQATDARLLGAEVTV